MHNEDMTAELVNRVKGGDEAAFGELYNSAYRMVYTTCLGHLHKIEDAEDATQEVFIKAYQNINSLQDGRTFYGWVKTIAINTSLNKLRSTKNTISYDDAIASSEIDEGDDNLETMPDSYILEEEKRMALLSIVRRELTEAQYQAVFMYYYHEMSVKQVAQTLGISEGTVKATLSTSRAKIKKGIVEYESKTGSKLCAFGIGPTLAMALRTQVSLWPVRAIPFTGGMVTGGVGSGASAAASSAANASAGRAVRATSKKAVKRAGKAGAAGAVASKFAAFKVIGSVAGIALAVAAAAVVVNVVNKPDEDVKLVETKYVESSAVDASDTTVAETTTSESEPDSDASSEGLLYVANPDGSTCTVSIGSCVADHVIIPSTSPDGLVVTAIDDFDNAVMTSIDIPDTVTTIDAGSFDNCTNLESLIIPDSVTQILGGGPPGRHFLVGCDNFKHIEFGSGLRSLPMMCQFDSLETVVIHDGVSGLMASAFAHCPNLRSIELPSTLAYIDTYAFLGDTSLDNVVLPESLVSIGSKAFSLTGISSIEIPANLFEIGGYAFQGCNNLESIVVPATASTIGNGVFSDCTSLTTVDYYARIIPAEMFYGCSSLTNVTLHEGVEVIGQIAFYETGLTELGIPSTATNIVDGAIDASIRTYTTEG